MTTPFDPNAIGPYPSPPPPAFTPGDNLWKALAGAGILKSNDPILQSGSKGLGDMGQFGFGQSSPAITPPQPNVQQAQPDDPLSKVLLALAMRRATT